MKYPNFLGLLRCPKTFEPLIEQEGRLVTEGGASYPIVKGAPILVKAIEPLHTTPPDAQLLSKNVTRFRGPSELPKDAVILHLGCGDVPSDDPRVISMDILPTSATDLVAEAECLPFRDNTLDLVTSDAVFEHLYDPLAAIAEVRRVLRPGGRFFLNTAFLQPYHGFPGHFFNMTPQAIETFLLDDFEHIHSQVPDTGTVTYVLAQLLGIVVDALPAAESKSLANMTVQQLRDALASEQVNSTGFFASLSEHSHRTLASTFLVQGQKPKNYEARRQSVADALGEDGWARLKRGYWAARTGVIFRHHEVDLYRNRCLAMGRDRPDLPPLLPLPKYLQAGWIDDTLDPSQWKRETERFNEISEGLIELRTSWIRCWLEAKSASPAMA